MLIAIYHILKDGVVFKDLGADYYNQFNKERKINAYLKKLKALWVGGSGSCRLNLLAEFKINVKKVDGEVCAFWLPRS